MGASVKQTREETKRAVWFELKLRYKTKILQQCIKKMEWVHRKKERTVTREKDLRAQRLKDLEKMENPWKKNQNKKIRILTDSKLCNLCGTSQLPRIE